MLGLRTGCLWRHELVSKALVRVLQAILPLTGLRLALPQSAQQHFILDELAHGLAAVDVDPTELPVGAAAQLSPVI